MREFKEYLHKQKPSSGNFKEKSTKENNVEYHGHSQKESNEALEFVQGVIVKINLPKPCSDAKKLKVSIFTS